MNDDATFNARESINMIDSMVDASQCVECAPTNIAQIEYLAFYFYYFAK